MSESTSPGTSASGVTQNDMTSMVFAQMVLQQTNLAMMLMGKVPHPQTGQTMRDLDSARAFIDQLEMIEVKTRGNLTKDEESLLRQSLTGLRMAFVEAVEAPAASPAAPAQPAQPTQSAAANPSPETGGPVAPDAPESAKKFSKKY